MKIIVAFISFNGHTCTLEIEWDDGARRVSAFVLLIRLLEHWHFKNIESIF